MEKMSLNKFTHILLLKNDAKFFIKKKVTNNYTKKSNHPKNFIKIKNMFQKKSHPVKIKINHHTQALKNQKKKIRKKKKGQHYCQCCCPGKREDRKKNAT